MNYWNTVLAVLSLCSATALKAQDLKLSGHIKGAENTEMVIVYYSGDKATRDTISTNQGNFNWEATVNEPQKISAVLGGKRLQFYVEPGELVVNADLADVRHVKITGSKIQEEVKKLELSLKDLTDQELPAYQAYLKATGDERVKLGEKVTAILIEKQKRTMQYMDESPSSLLTLDLVSDFAATGSYDQIQPMYAKLDKSLLQTGGGKRLAARMEILKRSANGEAVLDFSMNDVDGKPFKIADLKGKFVLVDFWASWCMPCRAEFPHLKEIYSKYKDNGFEIVGISLDDKVERWKKAINDDALPWIQLSEVNGFANSVSSYYGVKAIPSTLLLDKDGKIIAKDIRPETLEKELKAKLL